MGSADDRRFEVLRAIVADFVSTKEPIGSKTLVEHFGLGVSSATVRNEMGLLTDVGMLRQPNTSAGRVPSEEGYRYFVRRLLRETELPADEKRLISHQFHQARADVDEWLRLAAAVLARRSRVASVVTAPHAERAVYKHLELISTQARQVLLGRGAAGRRGSPADADAGGELRPAAPDGGGRGHQPRLRRPGRPGWEPTWGVSRPR